MKVDMNVVKRWITACIFVFAIVQTHDSALAASMFAAHVYEKDELYKICLFPREEVYTESVVNKLKELKEKEDCESTIYTHDSDGLKDFFTKYFDAEREFKKISLLVFFNKYDCYSARSEKIRRTLSTIVSFITKDFDKNLEDYYKTPYISFCFADFSEDNQYTPLLPEPEWSDIYNEVTNKILADSKTRKYVLMNDHVDEKLGLSPISEWFMKTDDFLQFSILKKNVNFLQLSIFNVPDFKILNRIYLCWNNCWGKELFENKESFIYEYKEDKEKKFMVGLGNDFMSILKSGGLLKLEKEDTHSLESQGQSEEGHITIKEKEHEEFKIIKIKNSSILGAYDLSEGGKTHYGYPNKKITFERINPQIGSFGKYKLVKRGDKKWEKHEKYFEEKYFSKDSRSEEQKSTEIIENANSEKKGDFQLVNENDHK